MKSEQGIVAEDGNDLEVVWVAFCLACNWQSRHPWRSEAAGSLVNHECKETDDLSTSGV
jgi:hypothetical protein